MSSNLLNMTTALGATCVAVLLSTATARAADATAHKRDIRGFKLGMSQKDNLALRHQLCVVSPPNELRMYDPRREEEAHQQDWAKDQPWTCHFQDGEDLVYWTTSTTEEIYHMNFRTHTNMKCPEFATYLTSVFSVDLTPVGDDYNCELHHEDNSGFKLNAVLRLGIIDLSDEAVVRKNADEADKVRQSNLRQPKL
jgi:hypothetical protein